MSKESKENIIYQPTKYETNLVMAMINYQYLTARKIVLGKTHWLKTRPVRSDISGDIRNRPTTAIEIAVMRGSVDMVQFFFEQARIDGYVIASDRLLRIAVSEDNLAMVNCLFDCGADIQDKANGIAMLENARSPSIIKLLLARNIKIDDAFAPATCGEELLDLAINYSDFAINFAMANSVLAACSAELRIIVLNRTLKNRIIRNCDDGGKKRDTIHFLLEAGANVPEISPQILVNAAYEKDIQTVKILLTRKDFDINQIVKRGDFTTTPLLAAADAGFTEMVILLLREYKNIPLLQNNLSVLNAAAFEGNEKTVTILLQHNKQYYTKPETVENELIPAFASAAANGHTAVVKILYDTGLIKDLNQKNANGSTILIAAAARGHTTTVKFLLDNGADLSILCQKNYAAIAYAASYSRLDTLKLLLEKYNEQYLVTNPSENKDVNGAPIISAAAFLPNNFNGTTIFTVVNRIEIFDFLWQSGLRPNPHDYHSKNFATRFIQAYTKRYYVEKRPLDWEIVRILRAEAKAQNIKVNKYAEVDKKRDGIMQGAFAVSLSKDHKKPPEEIIKYWTKKSSYCKKNAGFDYEAAMADISGAYMKFGLLGKQRAAKAKPIISENVNPNDISYIVRHLAPPKLTADAMQILEGGRRISAFPNAMANLSVSLVIAGKKGDFKPEHCILVYDENGKPACLYLIDDKNYYKDQDGIIFGESMYQDFVAMENSALSTSLAKTFLARSSGERIQKIILTIFNNPTEQEILENVEITAQKLSKDDSAFVKAIIKEMSDDFIEINRPLDQNTLEELTADYTNCANRAKNWVKRIRDNGSVTDRFEYLRDAHSYYDL